MTKLPHFKHRIVAASIFLVFGPLILYVAFSQFIFLYANHSCPFTNATCPTLAFTANIYDYFWVEDFHAEDYRLVWYDEFDGDQIDTTKWDYRNEGPRQNSSIVSRDNVGVDGKGHVVFTANYKNIYNFDQVFRKKNITTDGKNPNVTKEDKSSNNITEHRDDDLVHIEYNNVNGVDGIEVLHVGSNGLRKISGDPWW
eukprot:Awhi_evm1s9295